MLKLHNLVSKLDITTWDSLAIDPQELIRDYMAGVLLERDEADIEGNYTENQGKNRTCQSSS